MYIPNDENTNPIGRIDYIGQRDQLNRMTELLRTNPSIQPNSVNFWYDDFQNWLNRTRQGNAHKRISQLLATFSYTQRRLYTLLSLSPRLETKKKKKIQHITNQPKTKTNDRKLVGNGIRREREREKKTQK